VLKVHTSDGLTHEVDLADESQFRNWLNRFHDPVFQERITGLTVVDRGVQYSLPRPTTGFNSTVLLAEPIALGRGGERLVLTADDMKVQLTVHNGQRAARVAVSRRQWRKVFSP
jgi:hypothetical protein